MNSSLLLPLPLGEKNDSHPLPLGEGRGEGSAAVLSATGLTKRFIEGRLDVTVLQGVDLQEIGRAHV